MKRYLFLLFFITTHFVSSQTVVVDESKERVNGSDVSAVKTLLAIADIKKVERKWTGYLKSFGKVQSSDGILIIDEAIIESISATITSTNPVKSYSRITLKENGVEIWWAIENDGSFIGPDHQPTKYERAKNMLHQFGVDVYVGEINEDISEADHVIDNAAREYDRLLRQSVSLDKRVEKNRYDKIKLEEKRVENLNDSIQVSLEMRQNNLDQENALKEIEKLKQARESIRAKLEDVK